MEVRREAHEKNHNGMGDQPSQIKPLGTEVVSQGAPEGRRDGCDDTRGTQDRADPEKGFFERIGADIEDIERQEDIEEIERAGCPELGERDEDEISMTGLLRNHLCSRFTKILNRSIVDERTRGVKEGLPFFCESG
jgi:hypothetical protein